MSRFFSVAAVALFAACGGAKQSSPPPPGQQGYFVTIAGGTGGATFAPVGLTVPAGSTIYLLNTDSQAHRIVSEASPGAYTPGSPVADPFDTGPFTGTTSIVLKSGIADGTVLPYYCEIHKAAEATPNGTITIQAGTPPQPPPPGY